MRFPICPRQILNTRKDYEQKGMKQRGKAFNLGKTLGGISKVAFTDYIKVVIL